MSAVFATVQCFALLQSPRPRLPSPQPFPGTTALASPAGFEAEYEVLRGMRERTGRPLTSIVEVESHYPLIAQRLRERVDFNVPATRKEAILTFFRHPTAQFIVNALAVSSAARLATGVPLSGADLGASAATAVVWCLQEWLIHDKLLHSERSWFGETVHRWHHELPYYHVSLDGVGLAAVWFGAVAIVFCLFGVLTASLAPCLTALATYTLCGGVYEGCHYLAHTRCPLPPWLQRVRRHHSLHHSVDSSFWLAFTVPAIDTLMRTNPSPRDILRARRAREMTPAAPSAAALSSAAAPPDTSTTAAAPHVSSRSRRSGIPLATASGLTPPPVTPPPVTSAPTSLREQIPGLIRMARCDLP